MSRRPAVWLALAGLLVACGSGDSILQAGNEPLPATT
jgi:hypothetical protein